MENESFHNEWYIIFNPTSGGGRGQNKINKILSLLNQNNLEYKIVTTQYAHQEEILVDKAIYKGYRNFICIGGDGTIHHTINGIMKQKYVNSNKIKLAVIPTGTGNDWIKNYGIPKDINKAIKVVLKGKCVYQDIGRISLIDHKKEVFFNNAAGIGFDAFVVKNIFLFKKWRSLSYLMAALVSLKKYIPVHLTYSIDQTKKNSSVFLISLGICRYSGSGMQLTDYKNHKNGYFDLTLVQSISSFRVITNIISLYNGNIKAIKETYCTNIKEFQLHSNNYVYIQADGELIGKGTATFSLNPKAIQFVVS